MSVLGKLLSAFSSASGTIGAGSALGTVAADGLGNAIRYINTVGGNPPPRIATRALGGRTSLNNNLSTIAIHGFNKPQAKDKKPVVSKTVRPPAVSAAPVVSAVSTTPAAPAAPATMQPIDMTSLLKTIKDITNQSASPVSQVQNVLNTPGSSASNILGVADPSSLRVFTPQEILALAGGRANNEYKRLLSIVQANKLQGDISGQTQRDALQQQLTTAAFNQANANARTNFIQQQLNQRANSNQSVSAIQGRLLQAYLNGDKLTTAQQAIVQKLITDKTSILSPTAAANLFSRLSKAKQLRDLLISQGTPQSTIDAIAPPVDSAFLNTLQSITKQGASDTAKRLGLNTSLHANSPTGTISFPGGTATPIP